MVYINKSAIYKINLYCHKHVKFVIGTIKCIVIYIHKYHRKIHDFFLKLLGYFALSHVIVYLHCCLTYSGHKIFSCNYSSKFIQS